MRELIERFENLPDEIRASEAGDDAGFMREVSHGQFFVTCHEIELTDFRICWFISR